MTLEGQASDDRAIGMVEISFDRGTSWRAVDSYNPQTNTWEHSIDTTAFPDGRLFIQVRATDTANRTTTTDNLLYNVDNNPPVVLVTEPRGYSQLTFNTRAVFTITAADVHAIRRFGAAVEMSLDGESNWTEIGTQEVEQSTTWTMIFESGSYTSEAEPVATFRFFFWAEDGAGNRSEEFYQTDRLIDEVVSQPWTADLLREALAGNSNLSPSAIRATAFPDFNQLDLSFDEDGDVPVIEWIAPGAAVAGGIPETSSRGLLAGLFRDDDGINLDTARLKIERSNDFDLAEYMAARDGGEAALAAYVEDEARGWQTVQDWVTPVMTASDIRSVSWNYGLPDNLDPGYFRAQLEVADIDGVLSRPFSQLFVIDVPPEVRIERMVVDARYDEETDRVFTESFNGRFVNNDLTLYLNASAASGIEFVQVRLDEGEWVNATLETDGDYEGYYRAQILIPELTLDGDRTIQYRARDNSGKTTARFISVVVDTEPPEVEFTTDSGADVYRTVRVRGLVEDESPLEKIYLWIGEADNDDPADLTQAPTDLAEWDRPVTGSYSWFYEFDTTAEDPQGEYRLVARARDRAGNLSEPVGLLLNLNQEADRPVITLTNLTNTAEPTAGQNTLSSPIISGFVTDDDRVAGNSLQIRIRPAEGEWPAWNVIPTVPDAFFINWSYNLDLPDGVYEMGFRVLDTVAVNLDNVQDEANYAPDNYNWQEIGPVRFFVAANPPVVNVWDTNTGTSAWDGTKRHAYRTNPTITGNVTSSSGGAYVQYRYQRDGGVWSAWAYAPGTFDNDAGVGLVDANATTPWSFDLPIDSLDEGLHYFQVRGIDSLGGTTLRPAPGENPYRFYVDRTRPVHTSVTALGGGGSKLSVVGSDDVFIAGVVVVATDPAGAHPRDWTELDRSVVVDVLSENPDFYDGNLVTFGEDDGFGDLGMGGNGNTTFRWYALFDKAGNFSPVYRIQGSSGTFTVVDSDPGAGEIAPAYDPGP